MENQFSTQALIAKGSAISGGADASKIARWCMILATLTGIGYILWRWVLPAMVDIVWDVAQIAVIGIPTLLVVGFILSQRKNIFAFYDIMADKMFGKLVQMAPFRMQEKRIELAEQNYGQTQKDYGTVKGAFDRLSSEYQRQTSLYNQGVAAEAILRKNQPTDQSSREYQKWADDLHTAQKQQQRAGGFAQSMKDQYTNMKDLIAVVELGLNQMKSMIADAKVDLQESKTVFDVTMAGASAMAHMQEAMQGNAQVNSDAERATLAVMQRISLAVGQTQAAMEIVSDITRGANLQDAAKLQVARQQLQSLGTTDIRQLPSAPGALHYEGMAKQINNFYPID